LDNDYRGAYLKKFVIRPPLFENYTMRGMVLLYDMGEHAGSPLRCDIIDNGNHGNDNVVGANLCVRPT
jgi:hypothetical protein